MNDVTRILTAVARGEPSAAEELLPLVYGELRRLAQWHMSREMPGQTLQATALVHEAWIRLVGNGENHWENRRHFFAAAAEAMRRILIDIARRKKAERHGGQMRRTELQECELTTGAPDDELLAVHEAIDALVRHDPEKAELVKLRYFVGLTIEEAAGVMGISPRTAKRDWSYARAWLYREITRP